MFHSELLFQFTSLDFKNQQIKLKNKLKLDVLHASHFPFHCANAGRIVPGNWTKWTRSGVLCWLSSRAFWELVVWAVNVLYDSSRSDQWLWTGLTGGGGRVRPRWPQPDLLIVWRSSRCHLPLLLPHLRRTSWTTSPAATWWCLWLAPSCSSRWSPSTPCWATWCGSSWWGRYSATITPGNRGRSLSLMETTACLLALFFLLIRHSDW